MPTKFYPALSTIIPADSIPDNLVEVRHNGALQSIFFLFFVSIVLLPGFSCVDEGNVKKQEIEIVHTANKSIRSSNFAVVQGDTIDIGDYKLVNVQDAFEILQIDGIDAISYDGQYGYALDKGWKGEDYNYNLSVKDLKSGETIKSAWLIDIIRESEFADELDSYYLYNDTVDYLYVPDTLNSISDSIKSYIIRVYDGFGKYYFQPDDIDQIFASTRGIVIGSSWHSGSFKNPHTRFFIFINNDLKLEHFLAIQTAEVLVDFCIVDEYFQFANGSMISSIKHDLDNKTIEALQWGGYIIFDYSTLEFFYKCAGTLYSGKDQRYYSNVLVPPMAMVHRKLVYLFTQNQNETPQFLVKDLDSKKLLVLEPPALKSLVDSSSYINSKGFRFAGISEEYFFIKRPMSGLRFDNGFPIYAIPRKILDYAN